VNSIIETAWTWISAPMALRLYVLAAGAAVLAFALFQAYRDHKFLDQLSADDFQKTFRGPRPIREKTKRKRQREIEAFRRNRWRTVWIRLIKLLILGVVVPSAMLAAAAYWYQWFDPVRAPFLIVGTQQTVTHTDLPKLAFFVLDELMRGGFLDTLEVFRIEPHFLTHNHDNKVFSAGVLAYRTFVAIFEPTVLWFSFRAFMIARKINHPALQPA